MKEVLGVGSSSSRVDGLAKGGDDLEALLSDVWKAAHPDEHVREFRAEERQQRADHRRYRWVFGDNYFSRAQKRIAVHAQA